MRHTKSHTANRRSHHALKAVNFDTCKNCGAKKLRHRVCVTCGQYNGK
ncbi:MAG TPA: 50S ribosomal protein L32 [Candidatus Paceibacterota bacterium]